MLLWLMQMSRPCDLPNETGIVPVGSVLLATGTTSASKIDGLATTSFRRSMALVDETDVPAILSSPVEA